MKYLLILIAIMLSNCTTKSDPIQVELDIVYEVPDTGFYSGAYNNQNIDVEITEHEDPNAELFIIFKFNDSIQKCSGSIEVKYNPFYIEYYYWAAPVDELPNCDPESLLGEIKMIFKSECGIGINLKNGNSIKLCEL